MDNPECFMMLCVISDVAKNSNAKDTHCCSSKPLHESQQEKCQLSFDNNKHKHKDNQCQTNIMHTSKR